MINKDKPEVQDLFRHSEYREDKLKKLECLKKAKFDLIQQENEIFQAKLNEKEFRKYNCFCFLLRLGNLYMNL